MRVEAAEGAEENLAIQAERGAHGKKLGDLLQLAADARGGKHGGERRRGGQRGGKSLAVGQRIGGDGAGGLNQRNAGIEGQQLLQGLQARRGRRGAIEAGKARSGAGNHGIGLRLLAGAENCRARHGSDGRKHGAGVEAAEIVGEPAGPAGLVEAIEFERLPLLLLIGMRKKIGRHGQTVGEILRARDRLRQRPDVGEKGELAGVEQSLHFRKIGMQAEGGLAVLRVFAVMGSRRALRESQAAAGDGDAVA